jgi:hypothetical protein
MTQQEEMTNCISTEELLSVQTGALPVADDGFYMMLTGQPVSVNSASTRNE